MRIQALSNKSVENVNIEETIPRPGLLTKKIDAVNLAIAFAFAYSTAYATLGSLNSFFVTATSLGGYVFIALVINALPSIVKSFTKAELGLVAIYTLLYVVSYAISTDAQLHSLVLMAVIRFCIPMYLLGISVRNAKNLYGMLRKSSVFMLTCIVFSIFVSQTNQILRFSYSQDTGYEALLPFMIFLCGVIFNGEKKDWFGVVLAGIIILMSGARGPFFCAAVGVMICVLVASRRDMKRSIGMFIGMVIVISLLYSLFNLLFEQLISLFGNWNASTRILYGLLNGNLSEDQTRVRLRAFAWEYIQGHIIGGTGLINDRRLIYNQFGATVATAFGTYVHNFFLEVMMQIGLVPGLIVCIVFMANLIKSLIKTTNRGALIILVTFTITGFMPLMISRSYVNFSNFYLLVGLMMGLSMIRINSQKVKEYEL